MNFANEQLKYALQALALPMTGQLRLFPNRTERMDRLSTEYERWQQLVLYEQADALTRSQRTVLTSLAERLMQLQDHCCLSGSEVSWRRCPEWRQVRSLARQALLTFNWPLDLPPLGV